MQFSHNAKSHSHHQTHNASSSFHLGEKQLQPRTSSAGGVQLPSEEQDVLARKYGEVILNTFSTVAAALEYPKGMLYLHLLLVKMLNCLHFFFFSMSRPHQGLGSPLVLGARCRITRLFGL